MVKSGGSRKKSISKADKRRWMITSGIIVALLVAFFGFLAWFFYVGSSKEIVAIADQFKPDSSWELVSENIQPPATFCVDVECPSVHRSWNTHTLISKVKLQQQLELSGWKFKIDNDCSLSPNIFGTGTTICSASGIVNGYSATVSISGSNTPGNTRVSLNIEKR